MDIENYSIFKDKIPHFKDEGSEDNNRYCVESVTQFLKLIFFHKDPSDTLEIISKNIYYRGQANKDWKIECSLFRQNLLGKEDQMLRDIISRRPKDFFYCENNLERLVLLQHYGIPTRLLDITLNPLVALYFACKNEYSKDGAVYIFEEDYDLDFIAGDIISDFAFFKNEGTYKDFKNTLKRENAMAEDSVIENILRKKYILIKPKMNNERIIAQQGLFLCLSNGDIEGKIEDQLKLKKKSFFIDASKKILINKNAKLKILKELENIGIKQSILFPEIENHVEELIKKYSINEKKKKIKDNKNVEKENNNYSSLEIKTNKFLKELDTLEINKKILAEIKGSIDKDFFNFENKKAQLSNIVRRNKELSKAQKEKILFVLEKYK